MANSLDQTITQLVGLNHETSIIVQEGDQTLADHRTKAKGKMEEVVHGFLTFLPILLEQIDFAMAHQQELNGSAKINIGEGHGTFNISMRGWYQEKERRKGILLGKKYTQREYTVKILSGKPDMRYSSKSSNYYYELATSLQFFRPEDKISWEMSIVGEEAYLSFMTSPSYPKNKLMKTTKNGDLINILEESYIKVVEQSIDIYNSNRSLSKKSGIPDLICLSWLPLTLTLLPELTVQATKNVRDSLQIRNETSATTGSHLEQLQVPDLEDIRERLRR